MSRRTLLAATGIRFRMLWGVASALLIISGFITVGASISATDLGEGPEPISLVSNDPQIYPIALNLGVATNVGNTGWQTVALPHTYTSMVVVGSVNSVATNPPLVVRIQNASGNSFDVRVDRADGSAAPVTGVSVHYVVVEEGTYNETSHGVKMEAVKFTSTVTDRELSWKAETRGYVNSYSAPAVIGQVMTYNDAEFSVFWARGNNRQSPPTSNKLHAGKHVAQDTNTVRADETIGYIVIEGGTGSIQGITYTAATGADSILGFDDAPPYSYGLSGLSSATVAIVSQAGMNAGEGGWPVLYGASPVSSTTINLAIDEDQIVDAERSHETEQVAYIVFE